MRPVVSAISILLLSLGIAAILAACSIRVNDASKTGMNPRVGARVTVQFRYDAIGDTPPPTLERRGPAGDLTGVVRRLGPRWLVLASGEKKYWIPRDAILLIEE